MAAARDTSSPDRTRRADAERSVAAILDASLEALASDPEASMAEIARRAGVVRATIYVHFPNREALLEAVTKRAISDVAQAIDDVDPERGEPTEALERVLGVAWRALGRLHALVAVNSRLPAAELHRRHAPVLGRLQPLIERGQADGSFRSDVPAAWHLAMILALLHAASGQLQRGQSGEGAEPAVITTVLGAIGPARG